MDQETDQLRPVPIEPEIDLHAFAPADIRSVVEEYGQRGGGRRIARVRRFTDAGRGGAARHRPGGAPSAIRW